MFTTEDKREFETLAEAQDNSAKVQAARHNRDHFGDIAKYGYCTTCGYTTLRGDCTPAAEQRRTPQTTRQRVGGTFGS